MKIVLKILICFFLFSTIFFNGLNYFDSQPLTTEASSTKYTTTAALNLRAGAGKNYKVLITIPKNTVITVTSSKKVNNITWFKTTYKNKSGWVSGNYLTKVTSKKNTNANSKVTTSKQLYRTTAALNLRAGAGKNYKSLITIPNKTQITVTGSKKIGNTTWYKTTYKNKTGWVSGNYLVKVTPVKDSFNLKIGSFYKNIYTIKNPSNVLVLVNKNNQLSKNYVPSNLRVVKVARLSDSATKMHSTAATQLENMFKAAAKNGIELGAYSGYRSYSTQQVAYNKWKKNDSISARPGHSEHQTGLAMDVVAKKDLKKSSPLSQSFANTKEGKWIAQNAHKYGFIIRYPKGKEKITGYSFEPWHIRYVGQKVATKLYENNWTLEEAYINGYIK